LKSKKAIKDGVVTNQEHREIFAQAAADGRENSEELTILASLHEVIANGMVKRVA